jgi:hypothetical protein
MERPTSIKMEQAKNCLYPDADALQLKNTVTGEPGGTDGIKTENPW